MNKRIRDLALQANPASKEIYESDSWQFNCAAWSAEDLEKFAELIVWECINMVEVEAAQYAEPVWAVELVNDIKEHFGVKE